MAFVAASGPFSQLSTNAKPNAMQTWRMTPEVADRGTSRRGGRGGDYSGLAAPLVVLGAPAVAQAAARRSRRKLGKQQSRFTTVSCRSSKSSSSSSSSGPVAERPVLDQLITSGVKKIEELELSRVKAMSEKPSEENQGWSGEPREWADSGSLTQNISVLSQVGPLAAFKQFIADQLAGDYDREAISQLIKGKIADNKVMMFSFSTCPFCLRAKTILRENYGVDVEVYECDLEPEGNAVRAELGRLTGRTSMPSTWLGMDTQLGGCNDGGLGGVATLDEAGSLRKLLADRGALEKPWWQAAFPPNVDERHLRKEELEQECAKGPKNGVDAPQEVRDRVEAAATALEQFCPWKPATLPITGVWDLVYCAAPGSSNGRVGPFIGDVTQTIRNDTDFVNSVELFGGMVRIALEAERELVDDRTFKVTFKELCITVLGQEIMKKPLKGQGTWEQRYVDENLRVMNTPSLFVLKRRV
eukprot:CAMPEP_0178401636 /NCGR_PEP_ID=MMETSP0689_2-20121128/16407_1 /TAXON_ID=160604 /ORGANISM="Amphidinium massartii, Strain CS-259" /LENGTH=471 /DNA_ID=CAMNT_0020022469 /DNA_START=117 /DNA_END=1532 /DNA_ORIENTATION=+